MTVVSKFDPFVAVDIGNYSLKFVHIIRGEDGNPVIKALAHLPIPAFSHLLSPEEREKMSRDDIEKDALSKLQKFLTKHLTELLYDNQIQVKRAMTLASGRPVTIRYLEIPPVQEKDGLDSAIKMEAAKQMPFSKENAVMGFALLGEILREEKPLLQVMVAALQKDIVSIVSDCLKGGGLLNDGILTLPQSLEMVLGNRLKPPVGKEIRIAIIHCGHKTTSIMIYKNGVLSFYRDINMAGETITEAILAGGEQDGVNIKIANIDEAIELKHEIGVLPPEDMKKLSGKERFAAQQIFNTVEKIFQHIQLSISFYISQFSESGIDRAYLSGGSSAMKNFKEFIQESLEVPVEAIDPFKEIPLDGTNFPSDRLINECSAIAPAVGVALYAGESNVINFIDLMFPNRRKQSSDYSKATSNFSQSLSSKFNFKFQLDEQKIKILAGLVAILLLVVISTPFVMIRRDVATALTMKRQLEAQLAELTSSQKEVTDLIAQKDKLSKESGFSDEVKKRRFPNSEMLLELASVTPRQIFLLQGDFARSDVKRTFKIMGHADTSDRIFDFLKIMNTTKFFKSPSLDSTEEQTIDEKNYFMKFTISGKIEAPAVTFKSADATSGEKQ
ncbi:MAG: pilus assembly protein PilM [Candidatus Riflebacteria bacterium]|nr:pilus assembly protein PilM [Candidatus Riflebacteria bacterium]